MAVLDSSTSERFVKVAMRAETDGAPFQTVTLLGKRVAIFRREDGSLAALEMSCKHQGADLTAGKLEGGTVTCPRHGWRYDLATGACLNQPLSPPLRRHAVRVEGGDVFVSVHPDRPA